MDKKPEEPKQAEKPQKDWGAWQAFSLTSALGIEMAVCTVLGAYLGYKLDGRFDTLPWLTAIGVLLGMAAGIWGIIQTLKRYL